MFVRRQGRRKEGRERRDTVRVCVCDGDGDEGVSPWEPKPEAEHRFLRDKYTLTDLQTHNN